MGVFPLHGDGADFLDGDKVASLIGVEANPLDTDADMDFLDGEQVAFAGQDLLGDLESSFVGLGDTMLCCTFSEMTGLFSCPQIDTSAWLVSRCTKGVFGVPSCDFDVRLFTGDSTLR